MLTRENHSLAKPLPALPASFEQQFIEQPNRHRTKAELKLWKKLSVKTQIWGKSVPKAQVENTKRATNWGIKKFEKWCDKRKLKVDFSCVTGRLS